MELMKRNEANEQKIKELQLVIQEKERLTVEKLKEQRETQGNVRIIIGTLGAKRTYCSCYGEGISRKAD